METKLTELLEACAPIQLKKTTHALCREAVQLSRMKNAKKYLVLERYATNTRLCDYILRQLKELPSLPSVEDREYKPVLMLLALSPDTDFLYRLLVTLVVPYRKAYRTAEMLYLCEILHATGIPKRLYGICNEVCDYFFVERRNQLRKQPTPLNELDFQFAEQRLKPLATAVFRLKTDMYSYKTYKAEELAELCGMSYASFRAMFRKIYRQSPGDWLQERRIEQIKTDMKYNYELPIREIAERHDFSSPSRFWEFCKEQLERNPSELKKELYRELYEERKKFW